MQFFEVGGCVRDRIMGIVPKDFDYVVVGATTEQMLADGFHRVGKDFPVFLKNDCEYALARRERKSGNGHTDFTVETDDVTLEEDLSRRDLTINAIARDLDTDELIDPYNGQADIENNILRHVTDEGFVEDPLRVLRVARFLSRFPTYSVASETFALCKSMVEAGALDHLTPERITLELEKALLSESPSRFFFFLRAIGALAVIMPEIDQLAGVQQPERHHPEGDAFVHTMLVLEAAAGKMVMNEGDAALVLRFCALTHDLGKGVTPKEKWPKHHGHEEAGVPLVNQLCDRLRLKNELRDHAVLVCRYHTHIHNFNTLRPKTIVEMANKLRPRSNRYINLVLPLVSMCDHQGRGPMFANVPYPFQTPYYTLSELAKVKASDVCTPEELKDVPTIKRKMLNASVEIVKRLRNS